MTCDDREVAAGRVVKGQCFESCEVYSRGFESRHRNH